jgi:hypothetical protein
MSELQGWIAVFLLGMIALTLLDVRSGIASIHRVLSDIGRDGERRGERFDTILLRLLEATRRQRD